MKNRNAVGKSTGLSILFGAVLGILPTAFRYCTNKNTLDTKIKHTAKGAAVERSESTQGRVIPASIDDLYAGCLSGQYSGTEMWEPLLKRLSPSSLEKAVILVELGRCYEESERENAAKLLMTLFPLEQLITILPRLTASRQIGANLLLNTIIKEWATSNHEAAGSFVRNVANPAIRCPMLQTYLSASPNIGSPEWTQAMGALPESLWGDPVTSLVRKLEPATALQWLENHGAHLPSSDVWVKETFASHKIKPGDALEAVKQRSFAKDKAINARLLGWAAYEDPLYYHKVLEAAKTSDEVLDLVKTGFDGLLYSSPEHARVWLSKQGKNAPELAVLKAIGSAKKLQEVDQMWQIMQAREFVATTLEKLALKTVALGDAAKAKAMADTIGDLQTRKNIIEKLNRAKP